MWKSGYSANVWIQLHKIQLTGIASFKMNRYIDKECHSISPMFQAIYLCIHNPLLMTTGLA
jgi:hypothetical protein